MIVFLLSSRLWSFLWLLKESCSLWNVCECEKMLITISKSPEWGLQIAPFVQWKVQNPRFSSSYSPITTHIRTLIGEAAIQPAYPELFAVSILLKDTLKCSASNQTSNLNRCFQSQITKKSSKSLYEVAATSRCLTFFLKEWLKQLICYQNSQSTFFQSIN